MKSLPIFIFTTASLMLGCSSSNTTLENTVATDETFLIEQALPAPDKINATFDITVPAYQSDALRVEVIWGDMNLQANWVGDEYWSASADLPTSTEHTLSIIFYDENGAIELASFNTSYRTGLNAVGAFQVTANQFNSDLWDADKDGVSNLNELIAGTNPLADENSSIAIRDYYDLNRWSRIAVSHYLEALVPESRPISSTVELDQRYVSYLADVSGEVNIDENGNGTLSYGHWSRFDQVWFEGTRTRTENSISWEASRSSYDGDYRHTVSVNNTITMVDQKKRKFSEELIGRNGGNYLYTWETNSDLTGVLVAGTSECKPVSGSFSATYRTRPGNIEVVAITKGIDDPYWKLIKTVNENETSEFFVRELIIHSQGNYRNLTEEDLRFICD